jgi:hypothetical protein
MVAYGAETPSRPGATRYQKTLEEEVPRCHFSSSAQESGEARRTCHSNVRIFACLFWLRPATDGRSLPVKDSVIRNVIFCQKCLFALRLCACEVLFYPQGANLGSLNVRFWQHAQRLLTAGPGAICWRLVNGI